jgi:NitT/TauT family transport system substrate-binding protein
MALVKVALVKNFFEAEGLTIEVKEFTAGKFALQGLVGGSLDLITPAELPITLASSNGEKLSVLAEINETIGGFPLVLRKDGDNLDLSKYFAKKRKIATSIGGGPEFFTYELFKKYKISSDQYELVSMKPEDMPIALARGDVDGIAIFEPFAQFSIQKTGEDKVFVFKDDQLYSETIVLVGKTDWIRKNEKTVTKFLGALKQAEAYTENNQAETQNIMSNFTKLDKETLKSIWPTFTLKLSLNPELISTMEREALWAKETGKLKEGTTIPDFREIVSGDLLRKILPANTILEN